ncbi:MAG: hypothetical protein F4Z67_01735 [Synechococcus sp. SB0667_bin_8]|nr:hypothetical protein [Synechococcus sp. SB0667_bin_8]MYK06185.1 hypothetical protein [Synechococcus sp. SB0670_bin_20]MYK86611.1 hypothetical protein [Synechococcus sp. SB0669_bin_7]
MAAPSDSGGFLLHGQRTDGVISDGMDCLHHRPANTQGPWGFRLRRVLWTLLPWPGMPPRQRPVQRERRQQEGQGGIKLVSDHLREPLASDLENGD